MDEDTIKHSAIALANLSSHKDFMKNSSASLYAYGSLGLKINPLGTEEGAVENI